MLKKKPETVAQGEQIQQVPVAELHPFKDHPFKVLDDEAMLKTVESMARFGVLNPLIVRPRAEGGPAGRHENPAGHCSPAGRRPGHPADGGKQFAAGDHPPQ